jgi:hypothetical protein
LQLQADLVFQGAIVRTLLLILLNAAYLCMPIALSWLLYGSLPPIWLVLLIAAPWIYFLPKAQKWMGRLALPHLHRIMEERENALARMRANLEEFCRTERVSTESPVRLDAVLPKLYLSGVDGVERGYDVTPVGVTYGKPLGVSESWAWAWGDSKLSGYMRDAAKALIPLKETEWGKEHTLEDTLPLQGGSDNFPVTCGAMAMAMLKARTVWLVPIPNESALLYVLIHGAAMDAVAAPSG